MPPALAIVRWLDALARAKRETASAALVEACLSSEPSSDTRNSAIASSFLVLSSASAASAVAACSRASLLDSPSTATSGAMPPALAMAA